jgi:outer membrane biosynthesis protein TonB
VKKFLNLSFIATLAIVLGMISSGSALHAQTTPSATPDQQAQPAPDSTPSQQTPQTQPTPSPEMPPASQQTPTSQTPDTTAPAQTQQTPDATRPESGAKPGDAAGANAAGAAGDTQTFSGTVVKQGDKYVLKDDAGKTYDIDHQTDVAKFEGKRVRVQGSLDANGKIMVK